MKQRKSYQMDGLLALLLFVVFAVCILSVLLAGANAYHRLTDRDRASYTTRTAVQYLSTRVRQADCADTVRVAPFGTGSDAVRALVLTDEIEGTPYETRVYCYDGYIRELFSAAGEPLTPADGEKVLEAQSLDFRMEGALLTAEIIAADGTAERAVLTLRSETEAVP